MMPDLNYKRVMATYRINMVPDLNYKMMVVALWMRNYCCSLQQ